MKFRQLLFAAVAFMTASSAVGMDTMDLSETFRLRYEAN